MPLLARRHSPPDAVQRLLGESVHPLLARLYAARGITASEQLSHDLTRLAAIDSLHNVRKMAGLLADAIAERRRLLIVADYDVDGATACAVGMRALRAFGAEVDYLVPDRFTFGYGLTPEIVHVAAASKRPDILITVDNGIASVEGVAEANRRGIKVMITDHHLPGERLPDAWCIVNPNQPGCVFPSKHMAGVGVMFYVMLALRAELRQRGWFSARHPKNADQPSRTQPNLGALLDLVALGTVADVVRLDDNNRILVRQGLQRVRGDRMQPGIAALFQVAGRDPRRATVHDLGFALGPRLNAAGRLSDMALGIECLVTDDRPRALAIAAELDLLNRERRVVEAEMQETALAAAEGVQSGDYYTLSLFDPAWHQGVVGIVASRIKDRYHRPTIAFARGGDGEIKGSGRSIPGLHLRDALDLVAKRHPDLILKFGGHAAAAGVTLRENAFERFRAAFEDIAQTLLSREDLKRTIETDGSLGIGETTLDNALLLGEEVWGQGFPEPRFHDRFAVAGQRIVGERHVKLRLARDDRIFDAMLFASTAELPPRIDAVYRLGVNEFNGNRTLQLTVEHWTGD